MKDCGSSAVFTEQGSSASQMTATEVQDVVARLLEMRWAKQATQCQPKLNMEDAPEVLKLFEVRMSGHMSPSTTMHAATELAKNSKASGPSGKGLVRTPLCWIALRKTFLKKF